MAPDPTLTQRLISQGLMSLPKPGVAQAKVKRNYPVITNRCRRCGRVKTINHRKLCKAHMRKR